MITTAVMTKRKRSEHYVNNKEFLAALIKYREDKEFKENQNLPFLATLESVSLRLPITFPSNQTS
jgi:hypothetical protein